MPYTPVVIDGFRGLDVVGDPLNIQPEFAQSLLNADIDVRGAVRARDGYSNFTTSAAAFKYQSLYFAPRSPFGHLIGARANATPTETLDAIDSTGAVVATRASTGAGATFQGTVYFATVGNATTTYTYIAESSFIAAQTWDGTTFADAVFTGTGTGPASNSRLAAWQQRLAYESASGAIVFSNNGDSTIFTLNDSASPEPGSGETTTAFVTWGDLLLYIRRTRMYVFTGVSIKGDGTAQFNFRTVVFGALGDFLSCVVAPDAVYYLTSKGLYKTTGGPMVLVSEQPRGIFGISGAPLFWAGGFPAGGYNTLPGAVLQNRLYFAASSAGTSMDRMLVYDLSTGDWLLHDIAAQCLAVSRYAVVANVLVFGVPSTRIAKLDPTVSTDAGTAITWNWTSGYSDIGGYFRQARIKSGERKAIREVDIVGTGTVTHQMLTVNGRPGDVTDPGGAVTLGTPPNPARGKRRRNVRGTWIAHKLSGTAPAVVSQLTYWLTGTEGDT